MKDNIDYRQGLLIVLIFYGFMMFGLMTMDAIENFYHKVYGWPAEFCESWIMASTTESLGLEPPIIENGRCYP